MRKVRNIVSQVRHMPRHLLHQRYSDLGNGRYTVLRGRAVDYVHALKAFYPKCLHLQAPTAPIILCRGDEKWISCSLQRTKPQAS
jgi:hypothetical protein